MPEGGLNVNENSNEGSKTPRILNSPRVRFPEEKGISKTAIKKILEPVVKPLLMPILGAKRTFDQYSHDKQAAQSRISTSTAGQISSVC